MAVSLDGTPVSIGFGSVETLTGSGGTYRVGDAAVFVTGNMVAAINDDGVLFEATEFVDGSGLGLGRIFPMHVHDNGDGTFELYYQVYDADPLPAFYSNWRVTIDVSTGDPVGTAAEITTGAFSTTNTRMLRFAAELPDGNIFIVHPQTVGGASIVDPDGNTVHDLPNFGGFGVTTAGMHPVDVTVTGSNIFYTWVDSDFGEAGATMLQIYDLDGNEVMAPTEVSDAHTSAFGRPPAVRAETLPDGRVVVVWVDSGTQAADTDETSTWFKIYNADGSISVGSTLVNSDVQTDRQDNPLLIVTETGFVVGVSMLTFRAPALNEGRLYEFNFDGVLQSITEGAYNWGFSNAVRTDNNTAFILNGNVTELVLDGADGPIPSGPVSTSPTSGNDSLTGTAADEVIDALAGDDTIVNEGGGSDTFIGGTGVDTLITDVTSLATDVLRFDAVAGVHGRATAVSVGQDVIQGIENFIGIGGWNMHLTGDVNDNRLQSDAGSDTLSGGLGNDTLIAGAGDDLAYAGAGEDSLDGGDGNDTLYGAGDNDTLSGGNGADLLGGGPGDDSLMGGAGDDALWASDGNDTILGGDGADSMGGGQGDDSIEGGAGADELWGSFGNDTLLGGDGDDLLGGFDGNDSLEGGAGNDEIWGASGTDILRGGDDNDQIGGGAENDRVFGDAGNDSLYGGLGDDTVFGGSGDDLIFGAAGNDSLYGDVGDDTIFAGPGNDTVAYDAGADELQFFSVTQDRLQLDSDLWGGGLTSAQVVAQFGGAVGADFVLDFGGGNSLTLVGQGSVTGLESQIDIF